ncbi:hypothetical protein GJAV_G00111660 [Gymnothorax javanicus]|nr:hypothetical protein GJAV_G00111660 [Gymnothorax javanicus]
MNRTLLLALIAKCRKVILDDLASGSASEQTHSNATVTANATMAANSTSTAEPDTTALQTWAKTRPYDNAYCYILFVMFFYGFLALTLFRSFAWYDKGKTEPREESQDFEEEGSP